MSRTTISSANQVSQWESNFLEEYVRALQFKPLMGPDENAPIQIKEDLTKKAGDNITISLVKKLSGGGVTGTTTLEGNEESLANYGHKINVNLLRNGVRIHKLEEHKTAMDMREAARVMLKNWAMEKLRDDIIEALKSPNVDGATKYADTSEADKDTWLAANSDRVLTGAYTAGGSDHSADLAQLDTTNDLLTPALVSKARLKAKTASQIVRPKKIDRFGEWYILLCNPWSFRDLREALAKDGTTYGNNALLQAAERGRDNPIFSGGDMAFDGVIVKEVPEIDYVAGVGASSADVGFNFLIGAQALGLAWAQRTKSFTKMFDYDAEFGVAIDEIRGVEKLTYNNVQNSVVTIYTAISR